MAKKKYKYLKLSTGDELISIVHSSKDETLKLETPMKMLFLGAPMSLFMENSDGGCQMALGKWAPCTKDKFIEVHERWVVCMTDISNEMRGFYDESRVEQAGSVVATKISDIKSDDQQIEEELTREDAAILHAALDQDWETISPQNFLDQMKDLVKIKSGKVTIH